MYFAGNDFAEGRVILAQGERQRIDGQGIAGQSVTIRGLGRGAHRGEQDVVEHERIGLACLQQGKGFVMVCAKNRFCTQRVILVDFGK